MNNNKGDLYHLKKMTADIDFIIKHTAGMSMDELHKDEVLLDSMMFRLIQISESVKNLSTQFKQMQIINGGILHFFNGWTGDNILHTACAGKVHSWAHSIVIWIQPVDLLNNLRLE